MPNRVAMSLYCSTRQTQMLAQKAAATAPTSSTMRKRPSLQCRRSACGSFSATRLPANQTKVI